MKTVDKPNTRVGKRDAPTVEKVDAAAAAPPRRNNERRDGGFNGDERSECFGGEPSDRKMLSRSQSSEIEPTERTSLKVTLPTITVITQLRTLMAM